MNIGTETKTSIVELIGKIKGFVDLTSDDVGCEFLNQDGEVVILGRKDGEFFDGSDNYSYDCNGIAWTQHGICSILVDRIVSQY
jgi:hypothetical protein